MITFTTRRAGVYSWREGFSLSSRPGFTLIEMMVVMTVLGFFCTLFAALIWGAVKIERADAEVFQRMLAQNALADRFREDVARAKAAPEKGGDFQASSTCLILQRADGSQVVYRWHEGRLQRFEVDDDDEVEQNFPVGGERTKVEFTRAGHERRLIIMRLIELRDRGPNRLVEISTALGGDLR
jgi:prepilin-type N-terminal cleavage/methylation domain-containing protein